MTISTLPAESATLLDLRADMSMSARQRFAIADIVKGSALWRLCWTLGWLDIRLRYRGSMLGPFWLTLSTGMMVGALGLLYSSLFHMNLHEYLPFLSLSLVLWGFLGTVVGEACTTLHRGRRSTIRSVRMPFFVYATRIVMRNLLVLAHNIVVIVVVFALLSVSGRAWQALLAIPGLVLWIVDALALALLLGAFLRAVPRHPADRRTA